MRLWHYKLISYLPNKMLVSQWRECIAIKRQWEKGTLKHRLVNYIKDYDESLFLYYVSLITDEMFKRQIRFQIKYYKEIKDFCNNKKLADRYSEHNDRYLKQCYYNLQEKYDRGIITNEEWNLINKNIGDIDVG